MKRKQRGFTLTEVAVTIGVVAWICLVGGMIYAAFHFVSKFW